jgi:hypothetical protein
MFLAVVSGCNQSGTPANVSGKITYKGEVVSSGSIAFHPVAPKSTEQGGLGSFPYPLVNGTYSGSDLPTGEYVVTVETESANPDQKRPKKAEPGAGNKGDPAADYAKKMQEMGKAPTDGAANVGPYVKIPTKYAQKNTSPLKVTLTKGKNSNDFDLTD